MRSPVRPRSRPPKLFGSWPSKVRIALRSTAVSSATRTLPHTGGGTLSTFGITNLLLAVQLISNDSLQSACQNAQRPPELCEKPKRRAPRQPGTARRHEETIGFSLENYRRWL